MDKAIQSVLQQTFRDLEVVVVDNDDGEDTRKVVESFGDRRLRYMRTGGLSMQDNWEQAGREAKGDFVLVLEDKQMLKRHALEVIHEAILRLDPKVIRWSSDSFDEEILPPRVRRGKGSGKICMMESDRLLHNFLQDLNQNFKTTLPLPQLGCFKRTLLEEIRSSNQGRLFLPVSPDIILGLMALSKADKVCVIDSPLVLFLSSQHSNGKGLTQKKSSANQFIRQLPGGENDFYCAVPIKCVNVLSSVFNDFLVTRERFGGRLERHELSWIKYFIESFRWMLGPASTGISMQEEYSEWKRALSEQPKEIQTGVSEALERLNLSFPSPLRLWGQKWKRRLGLPKLIRWVKYWVRGKFGNHPEWRFKDPLDYYEWVCEEERPTPKRLIAS